MHNVTQFPTDSQLRAWFLPFNFSQPTEFCGQALFCDSTWNRNPRFHRTVFHDRVDFSGANFRESAFFRTCKFSEDLSFTGSTYGTSLELKDGERVRKFELFGTKVVESAFF
ncbi:pentapeptide repeat-containing protein [Arcanobacterium canis]